MVYLPVADQVSHSPVDLGIGDLIYQDEHQVIRHESAAGVPTQAAFTGCRRPDQQIDQWRDHPAKGQNEKEAAVLHPGEPQSRINARPPAGSKDSPE